MNYQINFDQATKGLIKYDEVVAVWRGVIMLLLAGLSTEDNDWNAVILLRRSPCYIFTTSHFLSVTDAAQNQDQ